jgi:hypothetical protein
MRPQHPLLRRGRIERELVRLHHLHRPPPFLPALKQCEHGIEQV